MIQRYSDGRRVRYVSDGEGYVGYAMERYERDKHDILRTQTH